MKLAATCAAAIGAALLFAVAAVLQQRSAELVPRGESLRPSLIFDLLRRPAWLAGLAAMLAGYGLEALALALGDVAVVAPLVVTELVFAVPISAKVGGRRIGVREWSGLVAVAAGVAAFLAAGAPAPGTSTPSSGTWLLAFLASAAGVAALLLLARRATASRRAGLLAAAAGICFAVLSVVTKSGVEVLARGGLGALLVRWQPWVVAALGLGGSLVAQSAYQAAPLASSLPIIDTTEPTLAVVLAVTVLGEHLALSPGRALFMACGALAAVVGVFVLGRSPLVLAVYTKPGGVGVPGSREQTQHSVVDAVARPTPGAPRAGLPSDRGSARVSGD